MASNNKDAKVQPVSKKNEKKGSLMSKLTPYLFISPWLIGFLAFTLGPLIMSLVMSFHDWPVIGEPKFIGLANYVKMFTADPRLWESLKITFKFAAIFVPLNMIIALLLALMLTNINVGKTFFRVLFYIPSVIGGVAVAIIWGWILDSNNGILNYILSLFGIDGPNWLQDPKWALIALVIASAWGVGSMTLIFYTDIETIPKMYYEAAELDGATTLQKFFKITLPIITPTIFFNLITSTISSLQQLELAMILTNGGPLRSTYFYGMNVYDNAFKHHKLGYASANAWFMFIIIMALTGILFKTSQSWVFYENRKDNK